MLILFVKTDKSWTRIIGNTLSFFLRSLKIGLSTSMISLWETVDIFILVGLLVSRIMQNETVYTSRTITDEISGM
jgi:hypothetical protein